MRSSSARYTRAQTSGRSHSFPARSVKDYRPLLESTLTEYDFPEDEAGIDEMGTAPSADWDDGDEESDTPVVRRVRTPIEGLDGDPQEDDG